MSFLCEMNPGSLGQELGKEGRERERERERERDIVEWGERREQKRGKKTACVFKRGQHWLILTDGLNQHMGIFGYNKWPYEHRDIFVHGK